MTLALYGIYTDYMFAIKGENFCFQSEETHPINWKPDLVKRKRY